MHDHCFEYKIKRSLSFSQQKSQWKNNPSAKPSAARSNQVRNLWIEEIHSRVTIIGTIAKSMEGTLSRLSQAEMPIVWAGSQMEQARN